MRREALGRDRLGRSYWAIPGLKHLAVRWTHDPGGKEDKWGGLAHVADLEQLRDALDERGVSELAFKAKLIELWPRKYPAQAPAPRGLCLGAWRGGGRRRGGGARSGGP